MRAFMQRWFATWLKRRIPAASQQTLSHQSIFILPSGFGVLWMLLTALLFLFGTNYQNNLVIGMSLLIASIFISTILHSYRNLAGLTLVAVGPTNTYAGQQLSIPIKVSSSKPLYQLLLSFAHNAELRVDEVNSVTKNLVLSYSTTTRGSVNPGRLRIESRYPLGLFRVWSWVDLNTCHVVFPAHKQEALALNSIETDTGMTGSSLKGVDEYAGLRNYIPGESLKQVAWKQWAQERGMLSKEFTTPQGEPVWLQLPYYVNDSELEHWLSVLSYQVDQLAKTQYQYWGLQLGQKQIAPSLGQEHRIACLTALARFHQLTPSTAADREVPR